MKIFLVLLLSVSTASAADLESVLNGAAQPGSAQISREQGLLVDTLRSLQEKAPTIEQSNFFRALEIPHWDQALMLYPEAFKGTAFAASENGKALEALLFFRSGLTVVGLEKLISIQDPKKIHFYLMNIWRQAAPETHPAWSLAQVQWSQPWTEVLGMGTEVRILVSHASQKMDTNLLTEMSKKAPAGSKERALIEWQLATAFALQDKADQSAAVLAALLRNPVSPISPDLIYLNAARLLYQKGFFDAAVRYYEKIPKSSDYWLESQEEMAWAYFRKGQIQDVLAVTQSLVNPIFRDQVGAETFFVRSLGHLRSCAFPEVDQDLKTFPTRFKNRALEIQKISQAPQQSTAVVRTLAAMQKKPMVWADLKEDGQVLPRFITRDERLRQLIEQQNVMEKELAVVTNLNKSNGNSLLPIQQDLSVRVEKAKEASLQRVQDLAKVELKEIKTTLDKLHIVEAELIQRVAMGSKGAAVAGKDDIKHGSTGAKVQDVLRFPVTQDVWVDELANYRVDLTKACQVRRE